VLAEALCVLTRTVGIANLYAKLTIANEPEGLCQTTREENKALIHTLSKY
jgi:hypothetical protein